MNNTFKKTLLLPVKMKIILFVTLSLGIFLVGYWLIIRTALMSLTDMQHQSEFLTTNLIKQQKEIKKFALQEKTGPITNQQQKKFSAIELTQVLTKLMLLSRENQLQVQLLEPQKFIAGESLRQQPIKISLSGNYYYLLAWLQAIRTISLTIAVKQFALKPVAESNNRQKLNLDAIIAIYAGH